MYLKYNTNVRKVTTRIDDLNSRTNILLSYFKTEKRNFNKYKIVSLKKYIFLCLRNWNRMNSCILKFRLWVFSFRLICWQFAKLVWYKSNRTSTTSISMREYQLYTYVNVKLPIDIDRSWLSTILIHLAQYLIIFTARRRCRLF